MVVAPVPRTAATRPLTNPVEASVYGVNSAKVERLVADVAAEPLGVPLTRNHIRAATTKVLARGK